MKISSVQYFQMSWLFPLVVPIVGLIVESFLNRIGVCLPDTISGALGIAMSAIFFFFIPYIVLVIGSLVILRNRSKTAYAITVLLSPVLMMLLVFLFLLLAGSSSETLHALQLAKLTLAMGYSYVLLIFMFQWILHRVHFIQD